MGVSDESAVGFESGGELAEGERGVRDWADWAVYLGVSWTWCIGMFLPALLWRDFGWASGLTFAVFALPNVVGAAAMGWVMRSPEASRAFVERHRVACLAFSAVTIAFQVYFAAWMARVMGLAGGDGSALWHVGWVVAILGTLLGGLVGGKRWVARVVAAVVWAVSVGVLLACSIALENDRLLSDVILWERGILPHTELIPLGLVCLLGFGLCPYLDLTFHRARIESGRASRAAFGVGFGFFFLAMIIGTIATAPLLLWPVGGGRGGMFQALGLLLALHTLPQLAFTCWAHAGEARVTGERAVLVVAAVVGAALALVVLSGSGTHATINPQGEHPMRLPEATYRGFMGFYGLVAPAYLAIVAWPFARGGEPITRGRVVVFAVAVLAAAPFYYLGFVERRTWWVAVGVGIVVLAALVRPRVKQP